MSYILYNPLRGSQETDIFHTIDSCLTGSGCTGSCLTVTADRTGVQGDNCLNNNNQNFSEIAVDQNTFMLRSQTENKCLRADLKLSDCDKTDKLQIFSKKNDPNQNSFQLINQGQCLGVSGVSSCDPNFKTVTQNWSQSYSGRTDSDGNYTKLIYNPMGICFDSNTSSINCNTAVQNYCQNMLNLNDNPRCMSWLGSQSNKDAIVKDICSKMYKQPDYRDVCKSVPNMPGPVGDALRCINGVTGGIHCSDVKKTVCGNTVLLNQLRSNTSQADTFCGVSPLDPLNPPSSIIEDILEYIKKHTASVAIGVSIFLTLLVTIIVFVRFRNRKN